MERYEREFLIARIDAGYLRYKVGDKVLKIYPPNKDVMYEAQELYLDTLDYCQNRGILTEFDVFYELIKYNIWTEQMEEDYKILPKNIETLKLELFNNKFRSNIRKKTREYLDISKKEYIRLHNIRHSWDYLTDAGIAASSKIQYIIENSTYYNGELYNWETPVINAVNFFFRHSLNEEIIRELARSDPWTAIWSSRTKSGIVFPEPMTTEQRMLISWTTLYDNIQQSPDFPGGNILDDDDMLDGWLIAQKKKREQEVNQHQAESISDNPKIAGAGEIFIPADTVEDAEKITSLNDARGNVARKTRLKQLDKQGRVSVQNFHDIRRQIQMDFNKNFSDTVKNNKG